MSLKENKIIVRRYFEDAPHNPVACDEIFAPRFLFHTIQKAGITGQVSECTPESEKATYAEQRQVWSDRWHFTVDTMIAEDDRVMVQWTFHGTQVGEFAGLPASNKEMSYTGINIFRIENGKIAEVWDIWDRLWMWQQLGVLPEIRSAIAKRKEEMELM